MDNDINHNVYVENQIDLIQLIRSLLKFKKLIISTILIFTIASFIYSLSLKPSFTSSAKLEMGYFELGNGEKELIESTFDLFSDLRIQILKNQDGKFEQGLSLNSFEEKVIQLEASSSSAELNENYLNEIIKYIAERHSNIAKKITIQKKLLVFRDIEKTKNEIMHYNSKLSDQYQSEYLHIISQLKKEDQPIEKLKLLIRNSANQDKLFSLNQELAELKALEKSNSSVISKTKIIRNIEVNVIKPKTKLIIFFGIIFGLITSIFLVYIVYFIKKFKSSKT